MSELALRLIAENKKTREPFLDLGNCGLTEVPEEIGELIWLEELSFASAWWDENEVLRESKNTGPSNNIARLPSSFACLQSLKHLYLNDDFNETFDLDDLSPLAGLTNLQALHVGATPVSDLSPLAGLTNLQMLNAGSTRVSDLSPLTGLTNLRVVDISHSQVRDLSPLLPLIEKGVPVKWSSASWEGDGIYVERCPLTNPPAEIVQQGNEAILRYFKEKR